MIHTDELKVKHLQYSLKNLEIFQIHFTALFKQFQKIQFLNLIVKSMRKN